VGWASEQITRRAENTKALFSWKGQAVSDEELRLECLRIAAYQFGPDLIDRARAMYAFVVREEGVSPQGGDDSTGGGTGNGPPGGG
jgi:hypothetical protein